MLLAVPVSLCDNQEPATLSMFATAPLNPLSLFSPVFFSSFLSLSVSQDEGPQHLISTSAVKVQRLLALLHIMKEGWSLDPPGKPLKDWVTERRIPELSGFFVCLFIFVFLRKCLFFSSFALASVEEDFLQRPTFCCCFLDMMEKKNLYRLIMLKACILTQDIDKHRKQIKHTHFKNATLKEKKRKKKKLCTCINKCKCQHKNWSKLMRVRTHTHTKHTNTHTSLLPFWFLCLHRCCALWQGKLWIEEENKKKRRKVENPG